MSADVAIVGGGIIGCSAAAFLAERGASVTLFESVQVGAGASGRNSGAVQHPFDTVLLGLHRETIDHYGQLAAEDSSFAFPSAPAGLLLLTDDAAAAEARAAQLAATHPELEAVVLDTAAVQEAEPIVATGLLAVRLATGYPIPPDAATRAWAERARRAGARFEVGESAAPWREGGRLSGVRLAGGATVPAGAVLLTTGPWLPEQLDPSGSWRPIVRTWGVTLQVTLPAPPSHILEEGVVHTVNRTVNEASGAGEIESLFSLVSAGETATLGSTFVAREPDPAAVASLLVRRGSRLVPALDDATVASRRLCARPQSIDGRPLVGALGTGLFVCAGHGPWGISTGPATARLAVDAMLDGAELPRELAADRFGTPPVA
jgi:glycine/D-amino acid oxidase-like deaminating enzyme